MSPIYLDYQATTPLAPEARAAMLRWLDGRAANPHSPHRAGREAAAAVEAARAQVAAPFGGGQLIFTGGATEAVNMALRGAMGRAGSGRRRLVTIATEHACVLDTAAALAREGYEAIVLPVDREGMVDLDAVAGAIDDSCALVSVMHVNNEIGVIQPIAALVEMARRAGALVHVDAAQGYGKLPTPEGADFVSISAHKIYGPIGIGALWMAEGRTLPALLHGGGQEGGIRSGTVSPALAAGFGAAAATAFGRMEEDRIHAEALARRLRAGLEDWTLNGAESPRWPGNASLRRDGLDAARLISELRGIAFSAGSACASGSGRPSHVLKAIGLSDAQARSSIRLGFGRYTTEDEIDKAVALIREAAERQMEWAA